MGCRAGRHARSGKRHVAGVAGAGGGPPGGRRVHPTTRERGLPGEHPQAYAVYVDDTDAVWLTDFGANAIVRFDPATERFTSFPLPSDDAAVRQLLGRPGEVWGAESARDGLVVIRSTG